MSEQVEDIYENEMDLPDNRTNTENQSMDGYLHLQTARNSGEFFYTNQI